MIKKNIWCKKVSLNCALNFKNIYHSTSFVFDLHQCSTLRQIYRTFAYFGKFLPYRNFLKVVSNHLDTYNQLTFTWPFCVCLSLALLRYTSFRGKQFSVKLPQVPPLAVCLVMVFWMASIQSPIACTIYADWYCISRLWHRQFSVHLQ